jgi:hypothetical protein
VGRRRKRSGKCLFCQQEGKLSREHVIPQWIGKALQIQTNVEVYTGSERVHTLEALSIVLPRICQGCNIGWMSDLEERVKPVLEPILLGARPGNRRVIDPSQQATLATWAVKTSLLLTIREFEDQEHGWIPADNLQWLYQRRGADLPPPGARVWVGGLQTDSIPASAQAACLFGVEHQPLATCGTFSVGNVIFQVFCCPQDQAEHPPEVEEWLAPKGLYKAALQQITHSSAPLNWPRESVFEADALSTLAGRLRQGLPGPPSDADSKAPAA